MTSDKDFIGVLEEYLDEYEGATPLPESVRDAVRAQLPTTKQIGPLRGLMRYPSMFNLPMAARYGLAAAVVVAAAVLGSAVLFRGENVGTGDPTASPVAIQPISEAEGSRELEAGTYSVALPVQVTFDVPSGWSAWAYTTEASQINIVSDGTPGELSFESVDNVAADPCTGEMLDPPVGPSVDDLVTALSNLEAFGFDVSPATDITIDGHAGKHLTLTAPFPPAGCDLTTWRTTTRTNGVGGGEVDDVRIVDVNGSRLVISIASAEQVPDGSAIHGIVDSLQLGP